MPRKFFHTALYSSVAAMLAMLATTAHSTAIVRLRLDPFAQIDNSVPGYNGYADFEYGENCLGQNGWQTTGTTTCGAASLFTAVIYLYGNQPGQGPGNSDPKDALYFSGGSVTKILVADSVIKGFDSSQLGPASGEFGNFYDTSFTLQFVTGCSFTTTTVNGGVICQGSPYAVLTDTKTGNSLRTTSLSSELLPLSETGNFPGPTAVPEPGTMSLILAALGGGWLARRRSKLTQ